MRLVKFLFVIILLPLFALYHPLIISDAASEPAGPGELTDITILPSVNQGGSVIFKISGSRVNPYTTLSAKHYHLYQSGDPEFSPETLITDITFTKTGDVFVSPATALGHGCLDVYGSSTYLASVCMSIAPSTVIDPTYLYINFPDPRLPYQYVNGTYHWYYSIQHGEVHGTKPNLNSYHVVSSTMPFDKQVTPYYKEYNNFVPTNYYWTDTETEDLYSLKTIQVTMIPNNTIDCSNQWAMLSVSNSWSLPPKATYPVMRQVITDCTFITYPLYQIANFSAIRNAYFRLIPYAGNTPTPTPTLSPTPSPTPTPYIRVIQPNGGNSLTYGQPYAITWQSYGIARVQIDLYAGTQGFTIVSLWSNPGSYQWTVNNFNLPSSTKFSLKITGYLPSSSLTKTDTSDTTFFIVGGPTLTPTPKQCLTADINKDGIVNGLDLTILSANFFKTTLTNARADVNSDGVVDLTDYSILARDWNQSTGACL
jgi:hypothetical protein